MNAVTELHDQEQPDLDHGGLRPIIQIRNLHKSFGNLEVLKGIDLDVRKGQVIAIIGPSGSGKSTLLRCINFLERYDSGSIQVDGVEVGYRDTNATRPRSERELSALRAETAMVFQSFHLFPHLTAEQNITLGLEKVRKAKRSEAREIAQQWLKRVGLQDKANSLPIELSGGQQQRVGIARAVAMDPKVLLLDEITSALDPELVGEVLEVVRGLAGDGMTMLLVTHEMEFARDVGDRAIFMENGVVELNGVARDMLENPENPRLRSFMRRLEPGISV